MTFNERQVEGVTILDVAGRFTFTAGTELSARVLTLHAFTRLRGANGMLKFVNPSVRTQHVLDITGIAKLVETFASEKLAVESFGRSA